MRVLDLSLGSCGPVGSRARFGTIPRAEQAVLYAAHLFFGRTSAQHAQISIDLGAVGVDYHGGAATALDIERQFHRQIALAARGRPCNERDRLLLRRFSLA